MCGRRKISEFIQEGKLRFLAFMLFMAFLAQPAYCAGNEEPVGRPTQMGGFEGPVSGAHAETVEMAQKLHQDSRVVLTGHILSRVAGERDEYIFRDHTGEMCVIIEPDMFQGYTITPDVKVRLSGKTGKLASSPDTAKVRVKLLEIVK